MSETNNVTPPEADQANHDAPPRRVPIVAAVNDQPPILRCLPLRSTPYPAEIPADNAPPAADPPFPAPVPTPVPVDDQPPILRCLPLRSMPPAPVPAERPAPPARKRPIRKCGRRRRRSVSPDTAPVKTKKNFKLRCSKPKPKPRIPEPKRRACRVIRRDTEVVTRRIEQLPLDIACRPPASSPVSLGSESTSETASETASDDDTSDSADHPRRRHRSAADTVLYWDAIKVPSPACLGLPGSAVPSLSKLCIKSILDAGVYVRDHPSATPDIVKQIDDELLAFPFLDLADPRPADEWPAATMTALTQPLESDTLVPAINLGVDVIDCAGRIYDLVTASRGVDALGERANMVRAMARYEVFLGLVHDNPDATLVPALDILTVWYSHLIRTDKYKTYCMERWGREAASLVDRTGPLVVLDAFGKLLTDDDDYAVSEAVAATAALWAAATGGETYEANLAVLYGGGDGAVAPAPLSVVLARGLQPEEVIRDRDWVDDLHSMISAEKQGLLAAHDERHLRTLVRSYERFLYLNAKYPSSRYLSVALDVDLVWHAHQLFPSRYEQDCLRLFGVRIPHIPWPEHTAEEEVDNAATLEAAWLDAFGLPFGSRPHTGAGASA